MLQQCLSKISPRLASAFALREIEQLELLLGESEEQVAEATPPEPDEPAAEAEIAPQRRKPARRPLPATLPRWRAEWHDKR